MSLDWNFVKREFVAGGTAGAAGILIGFPFDLIKVKLQSNPGKYSSALQCLKETLKEGGVRSLFKGCIPPLAIQGCVNSLMFLGDSITIRILEPDLRRGEMGSVVNTYIAGCMGGLVQCLAAVPADVVKCGMQANTLPTAETVESSPKLKMKFNKFSNNRSKYISRISKIDGPSFATHSVRPSIKMHTMRKIKTDISSSYHQRTSRYFSHRILSLTDSSFAIKNKSRSFLHKVVHRFKSSGVLDSRKFPHALNNDSMALQTYYACKHILRTEGIRGFYKGFGVTALRDVPSVGIYFFAYKSTRDYLSKWSILQSSNQGKSYENDNEPNNSIICPETGIDYGSSRDLVDSSSSYDMSTSVNYPIENSIQDGKTPAIISLIAGAAAGVACWGVIYPIDVIKTNMQISTGADSALKTVGMTRALYERHGIKVFYAGLGTTLVRAIPVNAVTFYFYEELKEFFEGD